MSSNHMNKPLLPKNIERIAKDEPFAFACHSKISCFTECCRQLDLALSPYDVLRLKNRLGLDSTEFLDRYVIIEQDEEEPLPRFYLTMVDDGKASCVFVSNEGCSVYRDRPGPCRAYPMGRAVQRGNDDQIEQYFVLLNEEHCRGFEEEPQQSPLQYTLDQGLDRYNRYNDALIPIVQHEKLRQGMHLTEKQRDDFILALYDIDRFRKEIFSDRMIKEPLTAERKEELKDDEKLLLFAIDWLEKTLFLE